MYNVMYVFNTTYVQHCTQILQHLQRPVTEYFVWCIAVACYLVSLKWTQ